MPRSKLLLALLLTLVSLSSVAMNLSPFNAEYIGYRRGSEVGSATQNLKHMGGDQYQLNYSSKASLFIYSDKRWETSDFSVVDGELVPEGYHFVRKSTGNRDELHLTFDSDSQQIISENGENKPWNGEYDHLLYRYDFQLALANGKPKLDYTIVNYRGDIRQYRYQVLANETLQLPYGEIDAVKVKVIRQNKKRETYLWFAPGMEYLMVRLQQFKSGKEQFDIQLSQYATSKTSPAVTHP